jgi:hypothetical protein
MKHTVKQCCISLVTGAILKPPAELRKHKPKQISQDMPADWIVKQGGVHLSWFGNKEQMKEKIHGSIEAHTWGGALNISKEEVEELYWKQKQLGKLFEHKVKFKLGKIKKLPLKDNIVFTNSMKEFIKKHPEWLLH